MRVPMYGFSNRLPRAMRTHAVDRERRSTAMCFSLSQRKERLRFHMDFASIAAVRVARR